MSRLKRSELSSDSHSLSSQDAALTESFLGVSRRGPPWPPRVAVLPVPFESTTSFEHGTRHGPEAIIRASQQVELYDREYSDEPILRYGIETLPAICGETDEPERMLSAVETAVTAVVETGRFALVLGGEHSISLGTARSLQRTGHQALAVVQFDAHCDLRDSYGGTRFSHACAARRLHEIGCRPLIQLGVRSLSAEDASYVSMHADDILTVSSEDVHRDLPTVCSVLKERIGDRTVFLTFDVDALDPSIVPATGTPEPDGLTWGEALSLLRVTAECSRIVAADCVELSPRPGLHHADFTIAKLLYKTLNLIFWDQRS